MSNVSTVSRRIIYTIVGTTNTQYSSIMDAATLIMLGLLLYRLKVGIYFSVRLMLNIMFYNVGFFFSTEGYFHVLFIHSNTLCIK